MIMRKIILISTWMCGAAVGNGVRGTGVAEYFLSRDFCFDDNCHFFEGWEEAFFTG